VSGLTLDEYPHATFFHSNHLTVDVSPRAAEGFSLEELEGVHCVTRTQA
jgi:hypothetical protein